MVIEKIEQAFEKTDEILSKGMHLAESGLDLLFHQTKRTLDVSFNAATFIMNKIFGFLEKNAKLLRYAGLPWTAVIPKVWVVWFKQSTSQLPILQPGMHMIRAKVGGGKSLLSLVLAEIQLQTTGYPSYFTSPVEKPQLSEDGKYWYVMHRVYDPNKYYKDGKKILNYNTQKYKSQHKDEQHLRYNPRLNKTKEYNAKYVPEHEDELLMRHDGMDNGIYKYSQHMKLDAQDMDSLTYMHDISTVKDLPIRRWLNDGALKIVPVRIKIESFTVELNFEGGMFRKLIRRPYNLLVTEEVLNKFDTHAERHKHAGLKKDYE